MVKVEVEVDTLDQLQALALEFDTILLDNMPVAVMRQAVEMTRGRAKLGASGGICAGTRRSDRQKPASTLFRQAPPHPQRSAVWTSEWTSFEPSVMSSTFCSALFA